METDKILGLFKTVTSAAVIEIAIVIAVAVAIIWLSQRLLPWLADHLHGKQRLFVLAMIPTLRVVVFILAALWIVPMVIETTVQNMVAILGAAGLAIGFALKDYVSSLIAGIVAVYELPYRPGDWIEVDGTYGEVKHIGMRAVEMVTPDDTVVFVPHLKLWNSLIHNANNGGPSLMVVTDFYLAANHDAHQVKQLLEDVALTSPYVQLKQPIVVIILEKPWGTHYRLKAYPIDPRQQFQFMTDLTARGKACLRALNIEFANLSPEHAVQVTP
ncbi:MULTISPECIES: mechanosensitive ion channel family protein [Pseudidiomarina]|uniref:Small-conductance mechanosensitive channel n=2 Tax=Pseudidiomarina TaxID=2800384 RepID=A0A368UMT8_9GAMM|nr:MULTISPECIES: mechanosensitive ion channel domain-containing protein [Pseudidiomarina]PWW10467.1 small-conductance mechanosensitive channel [Pseudidiomarina maritima]RBP88107.1 small-conductance mechanosensitive channel [Pseudidiomarina tainanensis]RCW30118.1 small-conductance mechanosensitive channel [Pseudidiomarina tainanensis]